MIKKIVENSMPEKVEIVLLWSQDFSGKKWKRHKRYWGFWKFWGHRGSGNFDENVEDIEVQFQKLLRRSSSMNLAECIEKWVGENEA